MALQLKCVCGKVNAVNEALTNAEVFCLRCSRVLPRPKPKLLAEPVATDGRPRPLTMPRELDERRGPLPPTRPSGFREQLYLLLFLALIPLALAITVKSDAKERWVRTRQANPKIDKQIQAMEESRHRYTREDYLKLFPGKKILGALLPVDTQLHWLMTGAASITALILVLSLFAQQTTDARSYLLVGLFTGTAGVVFMLAIKRLVGIDDALLGVPHFTWDTFLVRLSAWTLAVGLFEEGAKLAPVIWRTRMFGPLRWRDSVIWGLASGFGFGISEGVFYCAQFYNGIGTERDYLLRFVSCVTLHAVWTASAAMALYRDPDGLVVDRDPFRLFATSLKALLVVMVLHGLYDGLLEYELMGPAFAVACVSFLLLAYQITHARQHDDAPPEAYAALAAILAAEAMPHS